jgi:hypothetical protein
MGVEQLDEERFVDFAAEDAFEDEVGLGIREYRPHGDILPQGGVRLIASVIRRLAKLVELLLGLPSPPFVTGCRFVVTNTPSHVSDLGQNVTTTALPVTIPDLPAPGHPPLSLGESALQHRQFPREVSLPPKTPEYEGMSRRLSRLLASLSTLRRHLSMLQQWRD